MLLEQVPNCPICNGNGQTEIKDATDPFLAIEGKWGYKRCLDCHSLYMDPRPVPLEIPNLYPKTYYTHDSMELDPFKSQSMTFFSQLWHKIWIASLCSMGYKSQLEGKKLKSSVVGNFFCLHPTVNLEAKRQCRFLEAKRGKILDVGCGNGQFLYFMKELQWEVEGIEPDPLAARKVIENGIKVIQSTIEEVDLSKDTYDAITLSHVIEHLRDPVSIIKKLVSALKPGGKLISISPNPTGTLAKRFLKSWRGLEPPRHLVLVSPQGFWHIQQELEIKGEVFTLWRSEAIMFAQSKMIKTQSRITSIPSLSFSDILYGYFWGPWKTFFFPFSGEEVVFIAKK
ncbi:class I SAM-dependent methyltransferase [Methylacidiphilum fumariolicum]|uniref:class I SAM-dependent methyltransferase n=1 Tax=Candidatus Methylacidiphilum fumarolicum TaxID=591154 RepID=UPI001C685F13|nr:class I SAM-dependent methyltransferase [Candidatus Methylacidiphilum fumarolicum]MBW6415016.1 class I SAM-dependent methyltransferase [Candidatus Methylacidiphilum fumarolicum]